MRLVLAALVVLAAPLAAAQGRWLDTFAVPGAFGGSINAVVPDGAGALVGGDFAVVDDVRVNGVARWTGTAWETFGGPTAEGPFQPLVESLVQWQGRLVVSGGFNQIEQPGGAILDAPAVAVWDGASWTALPGLNSNATDLAVADDELFVSGGLAFESARWTGTTWAALDPAGPTGGLRLASAGRSLYLSGGFETAGGVGSPGLAEFDLDAVAAEPVATARKPGEIAVAPNPSRSAATLAFRLDAPGSVRLLLIDALGRTVAVLTDGERAAGDHTVRVDTSRLPAGVYVARLAAGAQTATQRLTVVR